MNELKNHGVQDILIACIDGLTGFPDAIKTVFPNAEVQQCIVHQVRNTMKYVPHKDKNNIRFPAQGIPYKIVMASPAGHHEKVEHALAKLERSYRTTFHYVS